MAGLLCGGHYANASELTWLLYGIVGPCFATRVIIGEDSGRERFKGSSVTCLGNGVR